MSDRLRVELDWEPGTLQRLIGLIERRGFDIVGLELAGCGAARQVAVEVQPQRGGRDFAVLCRQIDRLHGVERQKPAGGGQTFSLWHRFPLVG